MDGLQVAPAQQKVVNRDAEGLQYVAPPGTGYYGTAYTPDPLKGPIQTPGRKRTLCGLQPIVFCLSAIVAILIIGGAVGGGVGGSLANKSHDTIASPQSTSSAISRFQPTLIPSKSQVKMLRV